MIWRGSALYNVTVYYKRHYIDSGSGSIGAAPESFRRPFSCDIYDDGGVRINDVASMSHGPVGLGCKSLKLHRVDCDMNPPERGVRHLID